MRTLAVIIIYSGDHSKSSQSMSHSTPETFFLCSILVLFALVVAWAIYRVGVWAWRKCFGPHPDDHYSL